MSAWVRAGTRVAIFIGMDNLNSEAMHLLQWVFQRKGQTITCDLGASAVGAYEVSVIPHSDVSASVIETFEGAQRAFYRHAELAQQLREAGWVRARTSH